MEEVASTLALHGLSEYAAAFDTQGWDKMSDLYDIDSVDLEVLMKDVQMKPGHRVRLRKMLMNAKVAESLVAPVPLASGVAWVQPVGASMGATIASMAAPAEVPVLAALDTAPPVDPQSVLLSYQADFILKLGKVGVLGQKVNGTICETLQAPGGEVFIQMVDQHNFMCMLCPCPMGSTGATNAGKRSAGNGCSMIVKQV